LASLGIFSDKLEGTGLLELNITSGGITSQIGTGGIDAWGTVAAGLYEGGKLAAQKIGVIAEKLAAMFGWGEEAAYLNKAVDVIGGEADIDSLFDGEEIAAIVSKNTEKKYGDGVLFADAAISAAMNNGTISIWDLLDAEELKQMGYDKEIIDMMKGREEPEETGIAGANPYAGHEGAGVIAEFSLGSGAVLAAIYNSLFAEAYSGMENSPGVKIGAGTAGGPQVSIGAETAGMSIAKLFDPFISGDVLGLTSAEYGNLMLSKNMPTGYAFSAAATIPFGDAMIGFNADMETSLAGSINKLVLSGAAAFQVTPNSSVGLSGSYQWDTTVKIGAGLETQYGSLSAGVKYYLNDPKEKYKFDFKYGWSN
jgi:hypothetical protein